MRKWINLIEAAWDTDDWWVPKQPDHKLYNAHDDYGDQHPKGYNARFGVPAEVVNRYSYGQCTFLAYAMHERFGWPIIAAMRDGDIAHAYCEWPGGGYIDILGPHTEPDNFGEDPRPMSAEELYRDHIANCYYGDEEQIAEHLNDARKAVELFIAPKVGK